MKSLRGITVAELVEKVGDLELPDMDFARDLEKIQAEQPKAEFPEWPD